MTTDKSALRPKTWPEGSDSALGTPLQPSVVYTTQDADALDAIYEGRADGFTYSREGHPNARSLAARIDALEGAEGGIMTGSGMGAISAVLLSQLSADDHVIGSDQLYGRSLRLITQELPRMGVEYSLVDATDAGAIEAAVKGNTKLMLVEVVANPTLRIADMEAVYRVARNRGFLVAVDNTFTTPLGYRPFEHGADIVIHSVTKLLGGHSDAMLGYVAARDERHRAELDGVIASFGQTASPYDCWTAEKGLLTFPLRYAQASANAAKLARFLDESPKVVRAVYPGLPSHPDHNRAGALLGENFGNMVSFAIEGGRETANQFARALSGVHFGPTLGDVATVVSHSASSSHRAVPEDERQKLGITQGFFRISVGIEDADFLSARFDAALSALK